KLRLDLGRRHTLVVVPGRVVLPHVLQAEPPVFAKVPPRLGRPVFAHGLAAGHVAGMARRGGVRRIGSLPGHTWAHGAVMGGLSGAWQLALGVAGGTPDMSAVQSRAARLEALLRQAFSPTTLRVTDDSARHAGHAGARPGGETHYNV